MWNANLLRGCCSLVLLALLLAPVGAHAQSGFILTAPGTARASCTAITSPVTNQTWCADGTGAPSTYLWKVWNGTTYITVGGGGGGGGGVCGMSGFVTIASTDTTGTVTFGTPQVDTSYIVSVTTTPSLGAPPGVLAWFRNKTVNGFTVELTAAPGAGNSVDVDWIVTFSGGPATCGGAGITGTGTTNTVPLWTSSTTLGNSVITEPTPTVVVVGSSNTPPALASDSSTILGINNDLSGIPVNSFGFAAGFGVTVTALDSYGFGSFQTIGGPGPNGGFGDHITINAGSGNYAYGANLTIGGTNDSFAFGGGALVSGPGSVFLGSGFGNSGVSGVGSMLLAVSGHVVNVTGDRSMGFVVEPSSGNPIVTVSGTNSTLFWLDGGTSTLSGNNSFMVNLTGTNTLSTNKTFFVVGAHGSITMQDAVTTSLYNEDATGVGQGNISVNISGVTGDVTIDAVDALGDTGFVVHSPNSDGSGIGNVGLLPWGSRASSDGKVTQLKFYEADLSGGHGKYVGFSSTTSATPLAASVIWQLPAADAKGFFTSSGAGVLSIGTTLPSVIFTALGTPTNGTMLYCSDCDPTATLLACTHVGAQTGAFAYRVNGAWKCMG